jgi:ATP-dependent Clp protease ATP-binding subunit ClpA
MFERYTEPARVTIFYARAFALLDRCAAIDTVHLLRGLMWRDESRAAVLFDLRPRFPQYGSLKTSTLLALSRKDLPLTLETKKILLHAGLEADAMGDAWLDTEHLLLGILCEPECSAAQQLVKAGITLESARLVVLENRSSRPDYGPIIPLGHTPSPSIWVRSKWCWWKARWHERRFVAQQKKLRRRHGSGGRIGG